ncbi:MAG: histidine kinase [Dissulfurispiraceae bacterium]|nr:histidine kinase [Dissulfurispiraceae bacterium]
MSADNADARLLHGVKRIHSPKTGKSSAPHEASPNQINRHDFDKLILDTETSSFTNISQLQELLSLEDALYKTHLLLNNIFENINTPIVYLDTHLKVLKSNTAFRKLAQLDDDNIEGTVLFSFFMDKDILQACRQAIKTASPITLYSKQIQQNNAGLKYWDFTIQPVRSTRQDIDSLILYAINVTEKVVMQNNVQMMQELFRTAVENIPKCFAIYSAVRDDKGEIVDFKIEYMNKEASRSGNDPVNCPCLYFGSQTKYSSNIQVLKEFTKIVNTGRPISKEFICYKTAESDSKISSAYDLKAVKLKDGVASFWSDITEKKVTDQKLEDSKEQLRKLSLHLQSAREEERTRIARELHDELGQSLTALKMDIAWLNTRLHDNPEIKKKIFLSMNLINATLRSVKKICSDLRPSVLDHLGLSAAIEWESKEFENRTGIKCSVSLPDEELQLNKPLLNNLFRIYQEAMTNIAKHSKATEASVCLSIQNGNLILIVSDNGIGIKDSDLLDGSLFGIVGMNERVHYCNGTICIEGFKNRGTCITVHVPLVKGHGDDKNTGS